MESVVAATMEGGDVNRSYQIISTEILFFTLATIAVFARLYVRLRLKPKLWWDDWTMFFAYAWVCFGFVTIVMQVQYGLGRHAIYIGQDNVIQTLKWNQLARLTFIPSVAFVKMSICFFLLRILDARSHPRFRIYTWIVMGASVITNIILLIVWSVQCIPLEAVWDQSIHGKCLDQSVVVDIAYVQAGFNLVTDFLCALFPVFFFNNSFMRWRTRSALILLVALGVLTSVTALLRVVYLPQLEVQDDETFALVDVTICALIETKAGIFLTCLPAIKCLWTKFMDSLPARWTGRIHESSKTFDDMDSPIMPSFNVSSFPQRDIRDTVPLRPIATARDPRLLKGYEETPPSTPGFDGPGVKVTSWV